MMNDSRSMPYPHPHTPTLAMMPGMDAWDGCLANGFVSRGHEPSFGWV